MSDGIAIGFEEYRKRQILRELQEEKSAIVDITSGNGIALGIEADRKRRIEASQQPNSPNNISKGWSFN